MKEVSTIQMIKMEDLNHHGTLFAGKAMYQFCEAGFITAASEYKNTDELVFRAINDFEFKKSVKKGELAKYTGRIVNVTKTSITCRVNLISLMSGEKCAEGLFTYVAIDKDTREKKEHGIVLDETDDLEEIHERQRAEKILNRKRED